MRMVDRSLATHRGIDLRQQGRGNLHKAHASHVNRCGKPRHIANHAAAERDDHGTPIQLRAQHGVKNLIECFPRFMRLTIRQNNRHDPLACLPKHLHHLITQQGMDDRIRHKRNRRRIRGDRSRERR